MPGVINANLLRMGNRFMPDIRTITYRKKTANPGAYTDYTIRGSWYRPDGTEEGQPSQGAYLKRYRRWFFKKDTAVSAGLATDPLPDDLIVNTATTIDPVAGSWRVIRQTEAGALGAWELSCILMEIRSAFAVTVVVQRRTGVKDDTARMLPTVTTAATFGGWLQADDSAAADGVLGKLQMPTRGIVYAPLTITGVLATDTLLVSGTSYNIVDMAYPDNDQELQTFRVELAR